MLIPARHSMIPTVSIPTLRTLSIKLYVSDDGETVSVPESSMRVNTAASSAKTMRPARRPV